MSIGMIPFKELYGYEAVSFGDLILTNRRVPRERNLVQQSMDILNTLKETCNKLRINKRCMLVIIDMKEHLNLET